MSTTGATPTEHDALTVGRDVLLIDEFVPVWDATLRVTVVVEADTAATWEALQAVDLMRVRTPLTVAAFWVRGMMDRVDRRRRGDESPPAAPEQLTLEDGVPGWSVLGEQPGHELVLGAIGRFWTGQITWHDPVAPEAFADFREPGWGRIAAGFSIRPYGADRTLLTYDVRTATTDSDTRRRFLRYWRGVRPFVAHVMRATASMIATDAAAHRGANRTA